jgi:hypothetical protein
MTREQQELLYEITKWLSKDFYNEMEDHWTDTNYRVSSECKTMIRRLEGEYTAQYGALPEWKYIDDIWDTMRELKEALNG